MYMFIKISFNIIIVPQFYPNPSFTFEFNYFLLQMK